MNTEALRLFLEVAHRLSFAAVAEDRGINPSSVSRTISLLEDELGFRLLQRTTRRMTLTEAGETYFRRVASIIDDLDEALDQARTVNASPLGTLRITASVAFGERLLVPLLPEYREAFPDINLELLFTDINTDLVGTGIDLAIRLGPPLSGDVVSSRLFSTNYRVVASPEYLESAAPVDKPSDLTEHACSLFALPGFQSEWRFRSNTGNRHGREFSVSIGRGTVVSSALSLRSVVLTGGGPALLADWLVQDDISSGRLIDLMPDYDATATSFDTAAWIMYPSRTYLPNKVRVTIDFLRERLGAASS